MAAIPGFGMGSASMDRQRVANLTREIQDVAKKIAKLRGEVLRHV